ncbi:MAG TPA: MarR family transcriptional regulator [Burkholderiales bacterium]|jgi:predicted transcriptional regulator|nr:MarR family transcriptional regulator [Burkholderiales bacterium]
MPKQLEIRLGAAGDALDRFEAAWHRVNEGRAMRPLEVLSFPDLPSLLRTLSVARWQLLRRLSEEGPLSIYELAKRLERDYKNVHTDVTQLAALRLIERREDGKVTVPWELLRAELLL